MKYSRYAIYFDTHIGFSVRWFRFFYALDVRISVPFVTVFIGIGKEQEQKQGKE